jgi:hypothetical protein
VLGTATSGHAALEPGEVGGNAVLLLWALEPPKKGLTARSLLTFDEASRSDGLDAPACLGV